MKNIVFSLCKNNQRKEVYRLWYQIYFEEMRRNQDYANHTTKEIIDNLEKLSTIIIAENEKKEIIGTSRIHIYPDSKNEIKYYENLYQLDKFLKRDDEKLAIVTRYMVQKNYRSKGLGFYLALAVVNFCIKNKGLY